MKLKVVLIAGSFPLLVPYFRSRFHVPDPSADNLKRLTEVLEDLDGRVVVGDRVLAASAIKTFLRAGDKTLARTSLGEVDVLQGPEGFSRVALPTPSTAVLPLPNLLSPALGSWANGLDPSLVHAETAQDDGSPQTRCIAAKAPRRAMPRRR